MIILSNVSKSILEKINPKIAIAVVVIAFVLIISSLFIGFEIGATNQNTSEPFHLDLIETMNNKESGVTDAMASFYMVTPQGLVHPASITVPSHRWIEMTITTYDMGNLTVLPQYLQVNGTKNNEITIINGTTAMMDNLNTWEQNVTSVPASQILHTFTVTKLNLNIPVVAGTTEIAYIYLTQTGTFHWQCEAPCGSGSSGWAGPMDSLGWMSGNLVVT